MSDWDSGAWTAHTADGEVKVSTDQLIALRAFFVGSADLASRMSMLLWFKIVMLIRLHGVEPQKIMRSIESLESGEVGDRVKLATQFKHPPLKGLWHKHYFAAHFMPQNMLLESRKGVLERLLNEELMPYRGQLAPPGLDEVIARRAMAELFDNRAEEGRLTGEWLIFAKHKGKNYYLTVTTHDAGDQATFDEIMALCVRDFPGLPDWLN